MYLHNISNFLVNNYLVTIAIILYICAYFPFIYNMYKKKNDKQKFKNIYFYILIIAFTLVLIHSIKDNNYEIVLFCLIKIIIILFILGARYLYV